MNGHQLFLLAKVSKKAQQVRFFKLTIYFYIQQNALYNDF